MNRSAVILLISALALACQSRSEGKIQLAIGMTRADAQRQSTIKINQYGDSGRHFEFVLAGESISFPGCVQYSISTSSDGRIDMMSVASANESWPNLLREMRQTEALLLSRGWKRDPQSRTLASLPTNARKANITDSGAIDAFSFYKDDVAITLTPSGLWGGVPWWRSASRAKVFWRSITVSSSRRRARS